MAAIFIHRAILTDKNFQTLSFLTLIALFTLPLHELYASNTTYASNNTVDVDSSNIMLLGQPGQEALIDSEERHEHLTQLLGYLRKEGPGWVPGLAPAIHDPMKWAKNHLGLEWGLSGWGHSSEISDEMDEMDKDEEDNLSSLLQPVSAMMATPSAAQAQAFWLSPQYHHKGFLPTHDAVMMGFAMRHRLLDDLMQFDVHPFYGQNWMGETGYWGTEMAIGLGAGLADAPDKPWGKLALRYTNGDHDLMDSNRGFDMRGEFNFTDRISLNAGVRESYNSELGNYVLVRWKVLGP